MTAAESLRFPSVLVTGATGFVGRALIPALLERGYTVRACARGAAEGPNREGLEYARCDLLDAASLPSVMAGMDAAFYLVHSMGGGGSFREKDRLAASTFGTAAAAAGLRRIVYLGGVAPRGRASEHLVSRLEVGRTLREGSVPTIELRAAMIIGEGSASWRIVRDLAMRLPAMVLPAWLDSRLCPIAIEDAVHALVAALDVALPVSAWFDIPGPDTLTAKEILERIAALEGRRIVSVSLPWLTPWLSALWLRLVTRTNFALARELVFGLTDDLLPRDERYWELIGYRPTRSFETAARAALDAEGRGPLVTSRIERAEEALVRRVAPRLRVLRDARRHRIGRWRSGV